ncbi:MAG TPA: response regulator [Candidatus Hydrogenedentes bacterium]|nr:response regulator [Candidatus Hydrogenedentota bacterium]HNT87395.1 response regulator [Candidatus Hydrogenedentota bacterium]
MAERETARALGEVIEANAPEFARAILGHLTAEQARATEPDLIEWIKSVAALLQGQSGRTYEWVARIVTWARAHGLTAEALLVEVHRHRHWFLDFCRAHLENAPVVKVYDAVLDVEREYVQHLTGFWAEAEREVLAAERRRQATIVEALGRPCFVLDADGQVTLSNTECAHFIGARAETLMGGTIEHWCIPETAREFRRLLRQRRGAATHTFAGALRSPQNTAIPCRFTVHPLFDAQGLRCGLAVAVGDLAEISSIPLEERLRLFDDLAESLGIGFQLVDLNGQVLFTSSVARDIIGDQGDSSVPYCSQLFHAGQDAVAEPVWAEVSRTGQMRRDVIPHTRGGEDRWIEVIVAPQRTPMSITSRIICVLRDVTQLRALERSLIEQQRTSLASQLAVTVAHQLRNPLSVVIGFAEMLEMGMPMEKVHDAVTRLLRSGLRCKQIVEDLLNFGQGLPSDRVHVDLGALLRDTVQPLYPETDRHHITWHPPDSPCVVHAVAEQLAQVFDNLIKGAFGAGATEVAVTVEPGAEDVRVAVCDNGPEIPEAARGRLFEPFAPVRGGGAATELGLSLARYLVQDHGGRLFLDTAAGPRTCLVFELPLAQKDHAATAPRSAEAPPDSKRRLLVVDDELDLLEMLRTALEPHDFKVDTAATAAEAIALIEQDNHDAVVIDVQLPGELSGQHLYQFLRGAHPELTERVLMITADTMSYETRRFLQESGRPFLEKPFLVSDLLEKIERFF